jgi:hypothetical protein
MAVAGGWARGGGSDRRRMHLISSNCSQTGAGDTHWRVGLYSDTYALLPHKPSFVPGPGPLFPTDSPPSHSCRRGNHKPLSRTSHAHARARTRTRARTHTHTHTCWICSAKPISKSRSASSNTSMVTSRSEKPSTCTREIDEQGGQGATIDEFIWRLKHREAGLAGGRSVRRESRAAVVPI